MSRTRYTANALIKNGPEDEAGYEIFDLAEYKTIYGDNLDTVVQQAEKISLTNEAYLITLETYRPQYNDWETTKFIDYY